MLDGIVKRSARRVAAELRGLPEAERRALAPELLRYARGVSGTNEERVVHVALAGTATLKEIRRLGGWSASMITSSTASRSCSTGAPTGLRPTPSGG